MKKQKINIGLLGMGTVGTGVARILLEQGEILAERSGVEYNLKTVVDKDWSWDRNLNLSAVTTTEDVEEVLGDPEIEIVVETIGGIEPAYDYIMRAMASGKNVVTANKALIAIKGKDLFLQAQTYGVDFLFEASVGGGIPLLKSIAEGLVANKILSLYGIVNGTSNYVLTRMHQEGLDFNAALQEAQRKGFAEADPTLDVGGGDAAHKLTIMASLASGAMVDFYDTHVEGISDLTTLDIDFAKSFGYVIKLLAICRFVGDRMDLRVHPTLVPKEHLLAAVNNELNAVFVTGDYVGDTMFYGPGAGQLPTASAIVSNIVDISRNLVQNSNRSLSKQPINPQKEALSLPLEEIANRFYLRLFTMDRPGILSKIAGVLGEHEISISSVIQLEKHGKEDFVPIVLLTHLAPEKSMACAIKKIREYDFVHQDILCLRLF